MLNRLLFGLLAFSICHASPILEINRNLPRAEAEPEALKPRARSDRRRDDWEDLVPKTAHELYFASGGPTVEHKYADMAANFTGRAVVLEKSDFVKDVKCSAHAIDVVFSEPKAYDYVRQHWSDAIMLVTNSDTCGALTEERSFWDVTALTFEKDLTVRAAVNEEKGMDVVIDSVSLS